MTKRIAMYLALLGVFVLTVPMFGQAGQGPGGGGPHGGPGGHQMPSVDDRVKFFTTQLNLTDDQQPKVHDILQNQHDQMQKVMQDTSMARPDKRAKMEDIHAAAMTKLRGLLNDDQKKKFDDLQKQQHQRQGRRGGMGQG
jgi:hypothetical protein